MADPVYSVEEMWDSREGEDGESANELLIFEVVGERALDAEPDDDDPDEVGAREALYEHLAEEIEEPAGRLGALYRGPVRLKQRGGWRWLMEVPYDRKSRDPEQTGIEIDISTVNVKRFFSLETMGRYAADGDDAPDLHGAINVSKGKIEGTDVPVGELKLVIRRRKKPGDFTLDYMDALYRLAGKKNQSTFWGFPPGTLIFDGATASFTFDVTTSMDDQIAFEVPYRFRFSPHVEDLEVHGITVAEKRGWDYMHPFFVDEVDDDAQQLVVKPQSLHVEEVIEDGDFSELGIGTGPG